LCRVGAVRDLGQAVERRLYSNHNRRHHFMAPARTSGAATPLTSIFPKWLVVGFAVVALILAKAPLTVGLLWPEKFENATARFVLCAAIALNLAVFFFVLYPQVVKLTKIPILNLTIQLVGPIVLYIVVLLLLWKVMPEPATVAYRFFIPYEGSTRADRISAETVTLTPSGEGFVHDMVRDGRGFLMGVYVKFESGKDEYKARFFALFYKPADIVFRRGSGKGTFQVERAAAP